jgi:C4-type Zn-finger protein
MPASAKKLNGEVPYQRSCPKCDGYLGIVVPERKTPVQAINGRCLKCDYRLAWVVLGETSPSCKIA